ncbi:MAG: septum formation inhibitor Maf [Hespellia sp.]|jgi:septum formation protein|nr:septum formation inhibitor Maf [Hespellia sp.]
MKKKIILASGSPRRKELLEQIGIPFEVVISHVEEVRTKEEPSEIVLELALQKAEAVLEQFPVKERAGIVVLGADTIVVKAGKILGKPRDEEEAVEMIRSLQGQCHRVYTGVVILETDESKGRKCSTHVEETKVFVHTMTEDEISGYVATKEPLDKAGAYGIQGTFAAYIDRIEGDFYNVVGLPVAYVYRRLREILEEKFL